jgi:glycosyltransferase involved in cell wall biosynthesis
MSSARPALSVVVPVYNEAGNAAPLCAEIRAVVGGLTDDYEIIFVNDGSRDGTLTELRAQCADEPRLLILDLDGNFGEAAALSAGFNAARGIRVITLDGDGQNDARDIPRLLAALDDAGIRVATGWRQQRQADPLARVLPSRIANALIAAVSRLPVHDNGCGLKAYKREVLGTIQLPPGLHRFLPAILGVRAHEVVEVPVGDRRRQHGASHYGLSRTFAVLRDVLALPFLIRNPRRYERLWAAVAASSLTLAASVATGRWLTLTLAGLAALIWWNLHRFNRAQRDAVYRIRREYSASNGCE